MTARDSDGAREEPRFRLLRESHGIHQLANASFGLFLYAQRAETAAAARVDAIFSQRVKCHETSGRRFDSFDADAHRPARIAIERGQQLDLGRLGKFLPRADDGDRQRFGCAVGGRNEDQHG